MCCILTHGAMNAFPCPGMDEPEMGVGGYDEDRGIVQRKDEPKGKYVGPMCPLLSLSNHNASTEGNKK